MSKNIFEQGEFSEYKITRLDEAMEMEFVYTDKVTVFISHKHDDLEDLKGLIGFLEDKYNIKTYIDSRDPKMPQKTSAVTANRIKYKIAKCNKFIFLGTNGAIESKWCNWELGFGDAEKYSEHIAIFPMKPEGESDSKYKGNEYMDIYPTIIRVDKGDKFTNGKAINPGYYVATRKDEGKQILPLEDWLKNKQ